MLLLMCGPNDSEVYETAQMTVLLRLFIKTGLTRFFAQMIYPRIGRTQGMIRQTLFKLLLKRLLKRNIASISQCHSVSHSGCLSHLFVSRFI